MQLPVLSDTETGVFLVVLCVAFPAGVGGWAESGVNPAEYSRTLMRVACAYIEGADTRAVASSSVESACASMSSMDGSCTPLSSTDSPAVVVDPRAALDTAHKLTKKAGSATACVVQLCPEQKALIAANLVSECCVCGYCNVGAS
jgi:protein phosphatase PTC7